MDGMHRVAKAWLLGLTEIHAVQSRIRYCKLTLGPEEAPDLSPMTKSSPEVDSLERNTAYDAHADHLHVSATPT
jgi:hypothetical protein